MSYDFPLDHQQNRSVTGYSVPEAAERTRRAAAHHEEFADCMEMAFAGLVMLGALLFAASLLRYAAGFNEIHPAILHLGAEGMDFVATAAGFGTVFALGLGVFHFRQAVARQI